MELRQLKKNELPYSKESDISLQLHRRLRNYDILYSIHIISLAGTKMRFLLKYMIQKYFENEITYGLKLSIGISINRKYIFSIRIIVSDHLFFPFKHGHCHNTNSLLDCNKLKVYN